MHLDLSDDEAAALIRELHDIVESDRTPSPPRIRTLRAILGKLKPARSRALAPADGVCAAIETQIPELGEFSSGPTDDAGGPPPHNVVFWKIHAIAE
jgi:hypothetical protein